MPYMDVKLVGSDTYGKFCGGYLIQADNWYKAVEESAKSTIDTAAGIQYTSGWGLYVIASRYADCNGVTRSMPNGIPADYPATDTPEDGVQLGDPSESMLAAVLALAGGDLPSAAPISPAAVTRAALREGALPYHRPGDGALVH